MKNKFALLSLLTLTIVLAVTISGDPAIFGFLVPAVFAHCDTMNGPVVKAAQKALATGDVNNVLIWVKQKDESKIEKAFKEALADRSRGDKKSDMRFFETLVRVHREGEGAPYEGIKPAGTEIEPGIAAADKAVEIGSVKALSDDLSKKIAAEINRKFKDLQAKKKDLGKSVQAGREYVEAYVSFIHFVEHLEEALSGKLAE